MVGKPEIIATLDLTFPENHFKHMPSSLPLRPAV
jgi:hypothetical protein